MSELPRNPGSNQTHNRMNVKDVVLAFSFLNIFLSRLQAFGMEIIQASWFNYSSQVVIQWRAGKGFGSYRSQTCLVSPLLVPCFLYFEVMMLKRERLTYISGPHWLEKKLLTKSIVMLQELQHCRLKHHLCARIWILTCLYSASDTHLLNVTTVLLKSMEVF